MVPPCLKQEHAAPIRPDIDLRRCIFNFRVWDTARIGGTKVGRAFSGRFAPTLILAGLIASTGFSGASAGGLAVREQSSYFQGLSFAGDAAGGALSSAFWNSAALGEAGEGLTTDSAYTVIFGRTKFSDVAVTGLGSGGQADQNGTALVPGSYGAIRVNDRLVVGVAVSAPFGLSNEVDNPNWLGQLHHRDASLFTMNINPMASYEIAPGLFFGVGVQGEYARLRFETAAALNGPSATLKGDDIGFGYTLGLLWKPAAGTSIGLGFRSSIAHDIEGDVYSPNPTIPFSLNIDTPELVTLSFRQAVTNRFRFMGTVEWSNWSRFDVRPVQSGAVTIANFDFQYSDGWFFSLGGEYDYSDQVTVRAGVAYEISPVDDPTKRLAQIPDADRLWLSAGLTYKWSPMTSVHFGYTHIFVDDSTLQRLPASTAAPPLVLTADVESDIDIVTIGFTRKFGWLGGSLK
jgi:long-chain fatty acid transport protein